MNRFVIVGLLISGCAGGTANESASEMDYASHAQKLVQDYIIVDTHVDVPYRISEKWDDIAEATGEGDFDYPRAVEGGLNAPFMSIYIPAQKQEVEGAAVAFADSMIDMVEGFVRDAPDKFAIARSPAEVRTNSSLGIISLPMGMENGGTDRRHGQAPTFL